MTRHSQRHRSTTLPFRYRGSGLSFDIDSYSIDGEGTTELDLRPGQGEVDIAPALAPDEEEEDGEWTTVTINGQLNVPEETVTAVFPEEEREAPPAKLYVTIRCHETIYRSREIVSEAPTTPGTYDVSVTIRKEDVRGTVELRPYLVRTEDREGHGEYAPKKNFRVASGKIYNVVVDRALDEEPPAIDGEQVNFSQVSHLPDGDKLYHLDFRNESRPKLWINADHPRITEVLQSRGSVGAEARMRDVILDQMSYGVWMQLVIRAGSAVNESGDVEHKWQQTVLETFARNMYDVDDIDEAVRRLRSDLDDRGSLPHLMQRLDNELQEYVDPRTQLINLMEEGLQI